MRRLLLTLAAVAGAMLQAGVAVATPVLHLSGWKASAGKPETATITRVGGNGPAVITFRTLDGTAAAPTDYAAQNRTIIWANGQTVATVTIPTLVNPAKAGQNIAFTATITWSGETGSASFLIMEPAASAPVATWTKCADEGGTCSIAGTADVRYGAGAAWVQQTITGSVSCSNAVFGDPIYGTVKECDTTGALASPAPVPVPAPAPTPTPLPTTPVPLAVGVTAKLICPGSCSGEYRVDPSLVAGGPGFGYPPGGECDVYRCSVPSGEMVTLLGSALLYDGRVQWQVRSQSQGDVLFFTADELQGVSQ